MYRLQRKKNEKVQGEGYVAKATTNCGDERWRLRGSEESGGEGASGARGGPGELSEVLHH